MQGDKVSPRALPDGNANVVRKTGEFLCLKKQ